MNYQIQSFNFDLLSFIDYNDFKDTLFRNLGDYMEGKVIEKIASFKSVATKKREANASLYIFLLTKKYHCVSINLTQ